MYNPYINNNNTHSYNSNSHNNTYHSQPILNSREVSGQSSHRYILKQEIYNSIIDYFGDVIFTKINSKSTSDGTNYGIYYCKIGCMLCVDNRYLIAIVKEEINPYSLYGNNDSTEDQYDSGETIPIGSQIYLSNLQWNSFQTRSIDDFESINTHNIKLKQQNVKNKRNVIVDLEMKQSNETQDRVVYDCSENYPIVVDIMKRKLKEKSIYDQMNGYENEYYSEKCSLQTLLESYQCVLTIF
jgi:hypothetical protein